ncbi:hypothetical protein [Massilia endophytica]|uniref:hypothetical protein n=1 Tax=Massilia endophytica TaxID=2899220 RepID=UPI001E658F1D|nr:hypothetical protein [Massilia endophytica]UGQ48308.1 hypothetical protein LSQ66_07535 [Massilia endophytica]
MALFTRLRKLTGRKDAEATGRLGVDVLAQRRKDGELAPEGCVTVLFNDSGHTRRMVCFRGDGGPAKIVCMKGESAWCFHPGPYEADIVPFAAAPEVGLRISFVIDAADPRVAQQRFDLHLVCELDSGLAELTLASFAASVQHIVRAALEQGTLDLPPCTSLDEWNAFRAGLNQLMYTRFGVTVEDCIPVDLAGAADFAATLRERAAQPGPSAGSARAVDAATGSASAAPQAETAPSSLDGVAARDEPASSRSGRAAARARPVPAAEYSAPAAGHPSPAGPEVPPSSSAAPRGPRIAAASASETGSGSAPEPAPAAAPEAVRASAPAARATSHAPVPAAWAAGAPSTATERRDSSALRRLFLELPALAAGLRQIPLPSGQPLFRQQQALLQRLSLLALDTGTMPSLNWIAPDLEATQTQRIARSDQSSRAAAALDEAWALLAQMSLEGQQRAAELLNDADRILSNLEFHLSRRRTVAEPQERVEPKL